MVILGLGTNIKPCLSYLKEALSHITQIPGLSVEKVSPLYLSDALLPPNAPSSWDMPYLNLALRCNTSLKPYDLLNATKHIERTMGRHQKEHWGPRVIDIDILAWDDFVQYDGALHIPHEQLLERPFALWPLSDVAPHWLYPIQGDHFGQPACVLANRWGSRISGQAPLHTRQIPHRIDTPALMGILNITPDSFSDGGFFQHPDAALSHAIRLIHQGATLIDVGAESTRPHATPISPELEWQRLEPTLTALLHILPTLYIQPSISVDTRHPETAEKALTLGVHMINDVSGLENPRMCDVLQKAHCDVIMMHHQGIPADKNKTLPLNISSVDLLYEWGKKRIEDLEKKGITQNRIILDVGIGFGKTPHQSLSLLSALSHFKSLNTRLMVGHSRKSFLSLFTDKPFNERDIETLIVSLSIAQDVDYLRVHNIEQHANAFNLMTSLI